MSTPSSPVVQRADDRHRYKILVDGGLARFTKYPDREAQRGFYHTEVDEAFAGRGLAGQLVQEALTDVRAAGKRIVPVCPHAADFLTKHDEFADLTGPVTAGADKSSGLVTALSA
ncbi:GNAT family N-acetyltransferase [Kitasatospora aureofaciens]|uniref:GNAT family N-acetyltransferase n=1 Tax=Kitasatospora aureofaciens TaxID=1894 RepID=UPI0033CFF657